MDFGTLPPEINSGRLYSGPGTAPMLTAATAWEHLAGELYLAAASYKSVLGNLASTGWRGPASTMMAAAVAPYVGWLHETAARAEQTAAQAEAAAGAYQTARAAVIPPPLIEANRTQLATLVAGNYFGQNSPAIAATEAAYDQMWAQDAAAMYGYAGSSASAATLARFTPPPRTTQPGGEAAQTAAVAHAAATGAGHARDLTGAAGLNGPLHALAAPAATSSAADPGLVPTIAGEPLTAYGLSGLTVGAAGEATNDEVWRILALGTRLAGWYGNAQRDFARGMGPFAPLFGIPLPPKGASAAAASAVLGRASVAGALSVPPSWAATVAADVAPAATAPPAGPAAAGGSLAGTTFGESLMGTLAGRALSAAAAKPRRPDKADKVVPRSPAAG